MKNLFKSVSTLLLLCCLVSSISTQVFASTNSYNTNVEDDSIDTKASFFISGIGEDSKGEFIFVIDLNDVRHKAYIYSDYVGYNNITSGDAVYVAQYLLRKNGYNITLDGILGPKTYNAIVSFQRSKGLSADGIIGPNTWNSLYGR